MFLSLLLLYYVRNVLCFSYSQLNPLCFSLAYSGILVRRNSQRQNSSKYEVVSERDSSHSGQRVFVAAHKDRSKKEGEENATLYEKNKEKPDLCFVTCLDLFFQRSELMTQRRVVRRERSPLKLWNRLRHTDALLPCCWTHLTKLLYISVEPW